MQNELFSIGNIIIDCKNNEKYRIVSITSDSVVLCKMEVTNLEIFRLEIASFMIMIENKDLKIDEEKEDYVVDIDSLSSKNRADFENKLKAMNAVINAYNGNMEILGTKKPKPEIENIMREFSMKKTSFWRCLREYLQSGMKQSSLIDLRITGINKGKQYTYKEKPGKRSEYFDEIGIAVDEKVIEHFNEALDYYKSGRNKTIKSAYDMMNAMHYTRTEIVNGVPTRVLLPVGERPTYKQLYRFVNKKLSPEEKETIKTSAMEVRNNRRALLSDSLEGVMGPGDMIEIDACEADVSLVSELDPSQSVGRPIVYFMVDVFTRVILAVSVAFDNNSVLGITNLFLNLADDKQEYCSRYGVSYDNPEVWPSNIVPRRIRLDRGAEFKSKEFDRICVTLGIEKDIVSGGSGSLKGLVEQSFHQMHSKQNVHLENFGLIEKRHDSQHHKESTLNIEDYTRMVINFVLSHNQQFMDTYRMTKEMIKNSIRPIPAELWKYGVSKYGHPRAISSKSQFCFDLMATVKAKITRRGILYKGLYYIPENDPVVNHRMFSVGSKSEPIEVKMDMRDVSKVYYVRDGKMIAAPLNERLSGNAEFGSLTMKQWEDYRKAIGKVKAEGRAYNEAISAYTYAVNESIVSEAAKGKKPSKEKGMRPARELEKQRVSSQNKISERIVEETDVIEKDSPTLADAVEEKKEEVPKILSEKDKRLNEIKEKQRKNPTSLTQEETQLLMDEALGFADDED